MNVKYRNLISMLSTSLTLHLPFHAQSRYITLTLQNIVAIKCTACFNIKDPTSYPHSLIFIW